MLPNIILFLIKYVSPVSYNQQILWKMARNYIHEVIYNSKNK